MIMAGWNMIENPHGLHHKEIYDFYENIPGMSVMERRKFDENSYKYYYSAGICMVIMV